MTNLNTMGIFHETRNRSGGGRTDLSDPEAPGAIASSELTSFACRFSTLDQAEDTPLGNQIFSLKAVLTDGQVQGQYETIDSAGDGDTKAFIADAAFMTTLNDLLQQYNAADYNGISVNIAGLPPEYGASLSASYASGESIYADDNQDNFLSYELMEALVGLFSEAATETP